MDMATKEVNACAPCKSRGISSRGVKYCVICQEQLCKTCVEYHKSFKATKNHHLSHTVFSSDCNFSEVSSICAHHPNKPTEYYCDDHETFLCSHCLIFSDSHKSCPKVLEVESAGKYFLERNVTEKIKESSVLLFKSAENATKEITQGNHCTSESLKDMRREIETVRKRMLEAFDRQTNHLIGTISTNILQNRSNCERAMLNFDKFRKRITENDILLKTAIDDGDTAGIFRGAVSMIKQLDHFNRELVWTKTHCSRLKIRFQKSELVRVLETDQGPLLMCDIERTTLQLPDISSNNFENAIKAMAVAVPANAIANNSKNEQGLKTTKTNKPSKGKHVTRNDSNVQTRIESHTIDQKTPQNFDIELSYSYGADIAMPDGDGQPCYNGIVCLPDERLVLSDDNKSRLIMVKNNAYVSDKYIEFKPGNLALFNQFILVCLMKTNRLLLMKLNGNELKENRYLPTRFHPKCVQTIDNERILVSSKNRRDEWSFEIKTLSGQNWHSAEINVDARGHHEGSALAIQPFPALSGRSRIILYLEKTNSLKTLSTNGKLEDFCNDIDKATAVLADHLGYIFVTRYPGEVQVFGPDGHFVTSIYRNVIHSMKFAAFNKSSDKLFITTKDSKIHVIDVKRKSTV